MPVLMWCQTLTFTSYTNQLEQNNSRYSLAFGVYVLIGRGSACKNYFHTMQSFLLCAKIGAVLVCLLYSEQLSR